MSAIAKKTKTRTALVGAVLAAALSVAGLATAGTSADPEITDVAGDANWINGQGLQPGFEEGRDTRPASVDNVDLRAVWFETAYSTTKVKDSRGVVLRVEHRPTALVIHLQTGAPARPSTPWQTVDYIVSATLPGCKATFELKVANPSTGPVERAAIWHDHRPSSIPMLHNPTTPCGNFTTPQNGAFSPVTPTFEGTVSTATFPFSDPNISQFISNGAAIGQPKAHVTAALPGAGSGGLRIDETVAGRNFTIGQDVPPDVDCANDPGNPQCQS